MSVFECIGREGLGYWIDECTQIKTVVLPV
jgi:hypothetical protein